MAQCLSDKQEVVSLIPKTKKKKTQKTFENLANYAITDIFSIVNGGIIVAFKNIYYMLISVMSSYGVKHGTLVAFFFFLAM